ncbi:kinase-like protein [Suhomyces tanzawaensis NRRL Y-17324]|uniref:Kinase-like protein n=1 Tax=Suhomyces tanzawaensis NRRL Y-17324 TaxID=984487 RepID=A0A1E4SNE8_9ASCO|nr:kinase-like protein [Suhomyces tanzawaensis NRRL Y-17324]ODV80912.1 kinase-like protein [Suhomyces tanzawaensis NRRL Y-17324]
MIALAPLYSAHNIKSLKHSPMWARLVSFFQTGIRAAYTVSENPTFVSEPWSIYPAKHKQSGRVVSVFIFDKTKFEAQINKLCSTNSSSKSPRVIISECYELIKNELSQLSKLKHPQILTIIEVLEETKLKFLFVSEALVDNLVTVNFSKQLDNLSIQKGLLQVSKGVQFLHNYCTIVHFNLQPSSIFINNQGDWKLGGFKFLQNLNEISPLERDNFYIMNNSSVVPFANLNLNFTAPELLIDAQVKLDLANDIWSLGCLIYYLFNNGDTLISCFDQDSISDFKKEFRKFETKFYNHKHTELKYLLKNVPEKLYPIYPRLLARYPHDRLTIDEFIDSDFFNGSVIKAMLFIDEFSTKSVDEKFIFLKGLPETDEHGNSLLQEFPISFRTLKLLPLLIDLVISELSVLDGSSISENVDQLLSHALDITFKIGLNLSSLTFQDRVYDVILKDNHKNKKNPDIFKRLINSSVKTRLTLVQNITVLKQKLNDKQMLEVVKKLDALILTTTFPHESNQQQDQVLLQELFLKSLTDLVSIMEFPYIKNTLLPLICQVFKTTSILSTKLVTIEAFGMFVDKKIIDKVIVNEQLFPVLKNLKSRDKRIVKNVLNFFAKVCESEHVNLSLESSIESVLPQCFSLAFGCNDCSKGEFRQFMQLINNLQKGLTEKKISSLSDRATSPLTDEQKSFQSLINTQSINEGNKEKITKAPQSKTIMQPTRKAGTGSQRQLPSTAQARPVPTSPPSQQTLTPRAKAAPLTLKPTQPKKTPLTFGAVDQNSNNSNLFNKLNSTFSKDEDEFEDFQQASNTTSTSSNTPAINWNTKAPSTPTMGSMTPKVLLPTTLVPNSTNANNYPPGFGTTILTPNSTTSHKKTAPAGATNGISAASAANADLLDFL